MISRRDEKVVAVGYAPGVVTQKSAIFSFPSGRTNFDQIHCYFVAFVSIDTLTPRATNLSQNSFAKLMKFVD